MKVDNSEQEIIGLCPYCRKSFSCKFYVQTNKTNRGDKENTMTNPIKEKEIEIEGIDINTKKKVNLGKYPTEMFRDKNPTIKESEEDHYSRLADEDHDLKSRYEEEINKLMEKYELSKEEVDKIDISISMRRLDDEFRGFKQGQLSQMEKEVIWLKDYHFCCDLLDFKDDSECENCKRINDRINQLIEELKKTQ